MEFNLKSPPKEIKNEIKEFSLFLNELIPAKKLDRNVLICTWNIRVFGGLTMEWESTRSPVRDGHSLLCIVEIIKRFDIIAVQEVRGNIKALRETMRLLGSDWSFLMTDVTAGSKGNNERLAFIFDTRKVKLSGLACEIVIPDDVLEKNRAIRPDALQRQFARTPYAVSFQVAGNTFVLLTLHVLFGKKSPDRVAEIEAIADWVFKWAMDLNSWGHSLITLGDFNIVKTGDPTYDAFVSSGLYVPDDLHEIDRTIFKKTYSFYDQIAWFEDNLCLQYNKGGIVDFRNKVLKNRNYTLSQLSYRISDHFPLWAEFLTR
ncbi:endonuclease/exonuclease/phosphatase family protein [Aquiflexum sp.]|uniref:endonuclease/exonuclease/phosphatase family protein n=1 Tax=Aquiflexum sp. TaxID=1872584 RepID=UPI003594632F